MSLDRPSLLKEGQTPNIKTTHPISIVANALAHRCGIYNNANSELLLANVSIDASAGNSQMKPAGYLTKGTRHLRQSLKLPELPVVFLFFGGFGGCHGIFSMKEV